MSFSAELRGYVLGEKEGMKKLTNPVYLETTHFQLSDEQVELLNLEMAEFTESAAQGKTWNVRIRAIHAGTTKNLHTYKAEELEKSVEKWSKPYGRPLLKNHDIEAEPLGRVREADYIRFSDEDGALELVFGVPDADAVQKIHDQRYATVSVGVQSHNVCCSICGTNWYDDDCDHTPGRRYVDENSGAERLCTYDIKDIEPVECSFVNLPADANDVRYAGVIHIGEAEDIEFYADGGKGVGPKGRNKKSDKLSGNVALALKESWDEFLSQLEAEGDESHMDKETKAQETDSVEEIATDETVSEESEDTTAVAESEEAPVSEEATDGEPVEEADETDETTDTNVEESTGTEDSNDFDAIDEYLSEEDMETTEPGEDEDEEPESEAPAVDLDSLQSRVQELEEENSNLLVRIQAEEDAAAEWAKRVRVIISRHVADLKFVLNKSEGNSLEALENESSELTIKELLAELIELRKEFKEADFSLISVFSQNGAIDKGSLASDTPPVSKTAEQAKSEEGTPLTAKDLEESFTSLFSNRPPQKGRS